jgi:tRNA-Thr(GGU) m(6)t(6)A37 methyltransferase TsaA
MDKNFLLKPIGFVHVVDQTFSIRLEKEFIPGLTGVNGFSHLEIVWWGHLLDTPNNRSNLTFEKPYKKGPEKLGVFATRSPVRPNPVLTTTVAVLHIDYDKGIVFLPYIDAENGTPVLDIKPYHKLERIKECNVPAWCNHWPAWNEDSATFNWQNEFNF